MLANKSDQSEFLALFGETSSEEEPFLGFSKEEIMASKEKQDMEKSTTTKEKDSTSTTSTSKPSSKSKDRDGPKTRHSTNGSTGQTSRRTSRKEKEDETSRKAPQKGQTNSEDQELMDLRFSRIEKMLEVIATHVGLMDDDETGDGVDEHNGHRPSVTAQAVDIPDVHVAAQVANIPPTAESPDPDEDFPDDYEETSGSGSHETPEVEDDMAQPPHKRCRTDENNSESGIFFRPPDHSKDTFEADNTISNFVTKYLFSRLSNDAFKEISSSHKKPNIEFFVSPNLNTSVENHIKSTKVNKSVEFGEKFLFKTQEFLTEAISPLVNIWQNVIEEKDLSVTDLLEPVQRAICLIGSAFSSISSFRRNRLKGHLSSEFLPLIKDLDSKAKPSKWLFGDDLASSIKTLSEENKFVKKIGGSYSKSNRKVSFQPQQSNNKWGKKTQNNFDTRRVVIKKKNFRAKAKNSKKQPAKSDE